ncbi:MAG: PAS domain S-box protein [Acidobacteria bacterium]|nr:PAS domain S-box protein [Acidobacteriota bacterium]
MKTKDDRPGDAAPSASSPLRQGSGGQAGQALRRQAEEMARENAAQSPENLEALSSEETRHLLHELRVHQIELEMQNEELRRAQEELETARARYFDLYDLAPAGYFVLSEKGLIQEANLRAATMFGTPRGELLKSALTHLIVPEDQDIYYRHRNQFFKTGEPQVCELRLVKKDDAPFWARVEATGAQSADGAPICRVVLSDITERKRAEEEILQKTKELQEINEELTRFTYAVSHDLKSPLVTIQTFLGHLAQDLGSQKTALIEKDLGYIRNAADQMSKLLAELLELSRVGRRVNPLVEVPLQEVVNEALDLVAGRIAERGVTVKVTKEPVQLTGDRPRLVEVFQNLVDNAVKCMGDEPAPCVEIGVDEVGGETVLFVRDNGIGIDPQHQTKLFGMFEKLDHGTEGTGIGLALVKRIVDVHGGRIWVESEGPGKGTTFRLTLAETKRKPA